MVKKLYKLFMLGLITFSVAQYAIAQEKSEKSTADEITTKLTTPDNNALYTDKAKYTFEVINTTNTQQVGKVSYQVFTETGEKLNADSVKVKINKKSSEKYSFEIPQSKPGFYKISFMVNVTDYDDTTRRVFGIRPEEIRSIYKKPADFDSFWQATKDELAKVAPNFRVTSMPKLDTKTRKVYLIEMQSLDNMTIRGWMTIPITKNKHRKFAVWLNLPGYQADLKPVLTDDEDLAIISLNVRGQGNSRGPINTPREEYIFYHIENKNKYVMRGAIMDCIRCIDFIFTRQDLNHDKIFATGGSMGGFLTIATAALDKRVTICSAQNPIFGDIRNLVNEVVWPVDYIKRYVAVKPGLTFDKVLNNLDYFDTKNFAANITCPMLMAIGLLDPLIPPNNEYAVYNNMTGQKRIMVFKDLGHEVNGVFGTLEAKWMQDAFALF
ncbi:MAG TPA: alpha/beta fold hydrolase [Mucilaginibacter sp.]